jgi:hypothetical protein
MSKTVELDPRETALREPFEGDDDRNRFWISPFEVPRRIFLNGRSGFKDIHTIQFDYAGGETGDKRSELDDRDDPPVQVRSGQHTGKILEWNFGRPVSLDEFASISERLMESAASFKVKATTFNYRMIAAILRDWDKVVQSIDPT